MFEDLKIGTDVVEEEDVLPAKRSGLQESGVYELKVDVAYIEETTGGALIMQANLVDHPFEQFTLRERFTLTSGTAKGKKNTYVDKSTGQTKLLPGMAQANSLSEAAIGKSLDKLDTEDKMIKVWDWDKRKEVPAKKKVLTELTGAIIKAGVIKRVENKRARSDDGTYAPTNDKREFNVVDKFFTEEGLTVTEKKAKVATPEFINKWKEKWEGATDNRYKELTGAAVKPKTNANAKSTPALKFD